MKQITLAGWGQAHDALSHIAPQAQAVDYAAHAPGEKALLAIADAAQGAESVISWSMGGHMAVQAIARKWIRPKRLVLIAVPFQFVQSPSLKLGMQQLTFTLFRDNYAQAPERTLKRAHLLVAKDDAKANEVIAHTVASRERLRAHDWLGWLEHLGASSCEGLEFAHFPPTLLIHGRQDAVVEYAQAHTFQRRLPKAHLLTLESCGHAPHWHDAHAVQQAIEDFHV